MRFLAVLAVAALLVPTAALAQPHKKATPTTCAELADGFDLIEITPDSTIEDTADGCLLRNVFASAGSFMRYRLGEVRLTAPTLFADLSADSLPSALELTISGFQVAPKTGSPSTDYLIEIQSDPLDIHLAYAWDQTAHTLELLDFSVTSPHYGAYRVSARASDMTLDPAQLDDLENLPGTLDAVSIELDNARFLSAMLAPSLLGFLPPDADPRPLVEAYKSAANAFITGLPSANVPDATKAALNSFVAAFPKPTGDYTFKMQADPGLKFTAFLVDNPIELAALFSRLHLTATHIPLEQP